MTRERKDPLDLTVREIIARLLELTAATADADPWIDLRKDDWPVRRIAEAAKRGGCRVSRVGRKLFMRRSELDAWIERHAIDGKRIEQPKREPPPRIAHLISPPDRAAWRGRGKR